MGWHAHGRALPQACLARTGVSTRVNSPSNHRTPLLVVCKKSKGSKKTQVGNNKAAGASQPATEVASTPAQALIKRERAPVVRKYRRPKKTADELKEERQQQLEEWKASLQLPLEEVQFALRQQASRTPPIVLLDAYNIINAWQELDQAQRRQSLAAARQLLQEHALELSVERGVRVVVVYDALEGAGQAAVTKERLGAKATAVYSGQRSADIYLCEEAEFWVQQGAAEVVVVTNDNNVRHSITSAGLARNVHCMPVSWIIKECGDVRRELLQQVKLQLHKENLEWQKLKKLTIQ